MTKQILLIEDDQWFGELYKDILEGAGFGVLWCTDSYDALEEIKDNHPSALLLDLFLPWENGIALLQEIQSHHRLRDIPVVLFSAEPPKVSLEILSLYGVTRVIDKTESSPQDVLTCLKEIL